VALSLAIVALSAGRVPCSFAAFQALNPFTTRFNNYMGEMSSGQMAPLLSLLQRIASGLRADRDDMHLIKLTFANRPSPWIFGHIIQASKTRHILFSLLPT
jgi:hypothetical protein